MRLQGRRIVVTGAGSGIGEAVAALFDAHGARLALLDVREKAVREVSGRLSGAVALPCDVGDEEAVAAAVGEAARAMGGIDGVVNVAGIDLIRDFAGMRTQEWRQVMRVNLDGPMHVCKAALPALQAQGRGTIVNVASGAGLRPLANRTAYCAAKAGLVMFTKALAMELAPGGIRVNAVCPGVIDTPMLRVSYENADDPQAALREILARPAMGRVGEPADIAHAALHLTGDESRYTTGAALAVDGGRVFH